MSSSIGSRSDDEAPAGAAPAPNAPPGEGSGDEGVILLSSGTDRDAVVPDSGDEAGTDAPPADPNSGNHGGGASPPVSGGDVHVTAAVGPVTGRDDSDDERTHGGAHATSGSDDPDANVELIAWLRVVVPTVGSAEGLVDTWQEFKRKVVAAHLQDGQANAVREELLRQAQLVRARHADWWTNSVAKAFGAALASLFEVHPHAKPALTPAMLAVKASLRLQSRLHLGGGGSGGGSGDDGKAKPKESSGSMRRAEAGVHDRMVEAARTKENAVLAARKQVLDLGKPDALASHYRIFPSAVKSGTRTLYVAALCLLGIGAFIAFVVVWVLPLPFAAQEMAAVCAALACLECLARGAGFIVDDRVGVWAVSAGSFAFNALWLGLRGADVRRKRAPCVACAALPVDVVRILCR